MNNLNNINEINSQENVTDYNKNLLIGVEIILLITIIPIIVFCLVLKILEPKVVVEETKEIIEMKKDAISYANNVIKSLRENHNLDIGIYYLTNPNSSDNMSPWGNYVYIEESSDVGYIKKNIPAYPTCGGDTGSFVKVSLEENNYVYTICLYDDKENYIHATEKILYSSNDANDYYRNG